MEDLKTLFSPRSVALVGIPRSFKIGTLFLMSLQDQGFTGPIYPVNPNAAEIEGLRAYPSVADLPDPVDMAIVMVPRPQVMEVLEACAKKNVKSVVLYTSGYGESGDSEGLVEQDRIKEMARKGGFRLLGPNCMGIHSSSAGLAFFPYMPRESGDVALLSQSGSLCNLLMRAFEPRKLFLRHAVSYGNGCDVDLPELLEWMGSQPDIRMICAYTEGVRDGKALARSLETIAGRKPLIMWKVGRTAAGRKAAASHTGSLSGDDSLWKALFQQYGVLDVSDLEEMMDLVMAMHHLPWTGEGRVVLVSGPGGPVVSAADAADRLGLTMASLGEETRERLRGILPATGTSARNPVDVGLSASFSLNLYLDTLQALTEDPNVDAIVVLGGGISDETNQVYREGLMKLGKATDKALVVVAYPGFVQQIEDWLEPLCGAGIPVFSTPERALRAYSRMMQFIEYSKQRAGAKAG
jgi:acyl-CoA synthetase (NDP forming)